MINTFAAERRLTEEKERWVEATRMPAGTLAATPPGLAPLPDTELTEVRGAALDATPG